MKLIVGLGNPGQQYANTRHNIGFKILDLLNQNLTQSDSWESSQKNHSLIFKLKDIIFCKPQTFMNNSGDAVVSLQRLYKIEPTDIWVIHDDVDLEKGKIKIQKSGGSAGHNGIKSIIEKLGTQDFIRWRIGVGKPIDKQFQETADYVLENFSKDEQSIINSSISTSAQSLQFALDHDLLATMNKYN